MKGLGQTLTGKRFPKVLCRKLGSTFYGRALTPGPQEAFQAFQALQD